MITVRVMQDDCMSTGRCVAEAGHVFAFDDSELATVIDGQAGTLDEATAIRVARNCPNRAIIVTAGDGPAIRLD